MEAALRIRAELLSTGNIARTGIYDPDGKHLTEDSEGFVKQEEVQKMFNGLRDFNTLKDSSIVIDDKAFGIAGASKKYIIAETDDQNLISLDVSGFIVIAVTPERLKLPEVLDIANRFADGS
ncbi:hypothetical protein GGI12_005793 [Dipsacomyces acuminosporus]|nr:hypothetical protein GGI12_005793 [Dipsacomyces acuminosporus]